MSMVCQLLFIMVDPDDYTVRELRDDVLGDVDDIDVLEAALEAEQAGQDRSTAIAHIEARLNDLEADDETDDAEESSDDDSPEPTPGTGFHDRPRA